MSQPTYFKALRSAEGKSTVKKEKKKKKSADQDKEKTPRRNQPKMMSKTHLERVSR